MCLAWMKLPLPLHLWARHQTCTDSGQRKVKWELMRSEAEARCPGSESERRPPPLSALSSSCASARVKPDRTRTVEPLRLKSNPIVQSNPKPWLFSDVAMFRRTTFLRFGPVCRPSRQRLWPGPGFDLLRLGLRGHYSPKILLILSRIFGTFTCARCGFYWVAPGAFGARRRDASQPAAERPRW